MDQPRFRFVPHAIVIRTKESCYKVFGDKLSALPWGVEGANKWFDTFEPRLGGTPRETIEAGNGVQVEDIVDELEHLYRGMLALAELQEKYGELPLLAPVWEGLDLVRERAPWA
jgi:hypothetical protein